MSDLSANSPAPRPVSFVTVLFIFIGFALFAVFLRYAYLKPQGAATTTTGMATGAFNDDGIHTPAERLKTLTEMREKQNTAATTYGWVDQKAGVVRLPIDRAIELTAQQYGAKK